MKVCKNWAELNVFPKGGAVRGASTFHTNGGEKNLFNAVFCFPPGFYKVVVDII